MVLRIYRIAHRLDSLGVPFFPWLLYAFNRVVFSAVIPPSTKIGKGVLLGYQGLGIIIHRRAIIGDNVLIGAEVTIGNRSNHKEVPIIEHNVMIGNGAKILGAVRVGHHAQIGANAVVLHDVPSHAVAVGVPARIITKNPSTSDTMLDAPKCSP